MRKTIKKIIAICLLLLWIPLAFSNTSSGQIQTNINKILKSYDQNANIGILVKSLSTDKIIYQKNADQLFVPASALKIFPAVAALSYLGPHYSFQTKILTEKDMSLSNGVLKNDIYFYFSGDPTLTAQDINNLISTVARLGIHVIKGNVYIDDTIFAQEVSGPGWMWDERNFCYAAPVSAIIINKNCFPLKLSTPEKLDRPAVLTYNNDEKFISIYNKARSSHSNKDDCPLNLHATNNNSYKISGCVEPNQTVDLSIAVRNTRLYAKHIILKQLHAHNIKLLGVIKFKNLPARTQLHTLAKHNSKTLSGLLNVMLKESDNSIADAIYRKLGSSFFHKASTWKNSTKAIANILGPTAEINFNKMKIVDGSGLSRYNLVSPAQLVKLLSYAYNNKSINQPFVNALATPGNIGTLETRMPDLKNRVRAKTGRMTGIVSLAGYIKTTDHGEVAFAIATNSFLGDHQKHQKLHDEICTALAGI
jgi:serine-type D-Ala-D-Ala carboxypeptidase/endopeptidase (penicillin-binding protein 4)